jgi:hypothetical protein
MNGQRSWQQLPKGRGVGTSCSGRATFPAGLIALLEVRLKAGVVGAAVASVVVAHVGPAISLAFLRDSLL